MTSKWNIQDWLEKKVRSRDRTCVYCRVKFKNNFSEGLSWEHVNNKAKDIKIWNIALCCRSCNSSKGTRKILGWFESKYCLENKINRKTVAKIVKKYIEENKK